MNRGVIAGLVLLSVSGSDAEASAAPAEPTVWDQRVFLGSATLGVEVEVSCPAFVALRKDDLLYVACEDSGDVLLIDLSGAAPRELERLRAAGRVLGLFEHAGKVWAEIERVEARPVAELSSISTFARTSTVGSAPPRRAEPTPLDKPRAPLPPSKPQAAAKKRPPARVLGREDLEILVDLGADDGLEVGDRVELFHEVEDPHLGRQERRLAIGRVESLSAKQARVGLGLDERIVPGASARPSNSRELSASLIAPPRLGGLWELSAGTQIFLPISTLGVGALTTIAASYHFEAPIVIRAAISPLGLAGTQAGDVLAFAGWVGFGLDTQLFEITLGAGGGTVNERDFGSTAKGAFGIVPGIRIGAKDGLNFQVENGIWVYDDEFQFGFTQAKVLLPVATRAAIVLRGGGGRTGEAYGDGGVRFLLFGNGDADSLFITGALGGARLVWEPTCPNLQSCPSGPDLAGPSAGIWLDWRK